MDSEQVSALGFEFIVVFNYGDGIYIYMLVGLVADGVLQVILLQFGELFGNNNRFDSMRLRSTSPTPLTQNKPTYPSQQNYLDPNPPNPYYNSSNQLTISSIQKQSKPQPQQYTINIKQPRTQINQQPIINNRNFGSQQISGKQNSIPISMKGYRQDPRQTFSTYPILITQLENKNKQIQTNQNIINQIHHDNQQKQTQIRTLDNVIHSFYTKGAPLQTAKAKQIFDGSYPTLVQQADAMRKNLVLKNQQLDRLKYEKGRQAVELIDARYRVVTYGNRIRDLEYKLEQAYQLKEAEFGYKNQSYAYGIERQNAELKRKIMEMEDRNNNIAQQNNRLNEVVRKLKISKRRQIKPPPIQTPPPIQYPQPQPQSPPLPLPQKEVKEAEIQTSPQIHISNIFTTNEPQSQPNFPESPIPNQQSPTTSPYLQSLQKQKQIKQLQQRLAELRQQNTQLMQQQHSFIQQIYNDKPPEVSFLDDKERDPYELTKNNTSLTHDVSKMVDNNSYESYARIRKNTGYSLDDIEQRIKTLRNQSSMMMSKK